MTPCLLVLVRQRKQSQLLRKHSRQTNGSSYRTVIWLLASCLPWTQFSRKLSTSPRRLSESGSPRCPATSSLSLLCKTESKLLQSRPKASGTTFEAPTWLLVKTNLTVARSQSSSDVCCGDCASLMPSFSNEESSVRSGGIFRMNFQFLTYVFRRTNCSNLLIITMMFHMKL